MHAIAKVNCRHQNARKWSFHPNKKLKSHETMKLILCFMLLKIFGCWSMIFSIFYFKKRLSGCVEIFLFWREASRNCGFFFLEKFKFPTVSNGQNSNFQKSTISGRSLAIYFSVFDHFALICYSKPLNKLKLLHQIFWIFYEEAK
jgi:hypothetical protein